MRHTKTIQIESSELYYSIVIELNNYISLNQSCIYYTTAITLILRRAACIFSARRSREGRPGCVLREIMPSSTGRARALCCSGPLARGISFGWRSSMTVNGSSLRSHLMVSSKDRSLSLELGASSGLDFTNPALDADNNTALALHPGVTGEDLLRCHRRVLIGSQFRPPIPPSSPRR